MSYQNRYTLADYAQEAGLKGVEMDMVHTIEDAEPLFSAAPLIKCNAGRINLTQVVTKYPVGQSRGFNMGVVAEKAGTRVVQDSCSMFETYNEIDVNIVAMNGNSASWRAKQDSIFVRGLSHSIAKRIFCGSKKEDPFAFDGLRARYNKINGDNVVNAGGTTGTLEDVFLVNWGPATVHLIYPEGGSAGLTQSCERNVDARDDKNRLFKVDRSWYKWDMGLAVPDPAQVVRVANVPLDKALKGRGTDGYDLINALIMAVEGLPNTPEAGCAIYMSKKMRAALRLQINATPNVNLTWDTVAGKRVLSFDGIAVHKVEDTVLPSYTTPVA